MCPACAIFLGRLLLQGGLWWLWTTALNILHDCGLKSPLLCGDSLRRPHSALAVGNTVGGTSAWEPHLCRRYEQQCLPFQGLWTSCSFSSLFISTSQVLALDTAKPQGYFLAVLPSSGHPHQPSFLAAHCCSWFSSRLPIRDFQGQPRG